MGIPIPGKNGLYNETGLYKLAPNDPNNIGAKYKTEIIKIQLLKIKFTDVIVV